MLRVVDILQAAAKRQIGAKPTAWASGVSEKAAAQSDDIQIEAEHSRSPAALRRQMVRADLTRMMRAFGVHPDNWPLYQDELAEAEYTCALCRHVGRCRAWSAKGCRGDAPRLFCANAALFEEMTPDSFWSEIVPGSWHSGAQTSPILRLLASEDLALAEAPPRLGARRLERFISVALAVDSLIESWSPRVKSAYQWTKAARLIADVDVAFDKLFDHQDGFEKADFARILQVALCDPRLAECLCRLHARSREKVVGAKPVTV